MWAGAFWWTSTLLITNAISWSILLGGGTHSSLFRQQFELHFGLRLLLQLLAVGASLVLLPELYLQVVRLLALHHPSLLSCLFLSLSLPGLGAPPFINISIMFVMPTLYSFSSSWWVSHFCSLCCIHVIIPSHCASSRAAWVSNRFAKCPTVRCSCVSSCACCPIILSIRLLQSLGALEISGPQLLSLFPFSWCSSCSAAVAVAGAAAVIDAMPAPPFAGLIPPAPTVSVAPPLIGIPIPCNTPVGLSCTGLPSFLIWWSSRGPVLTLLSKFQTSSDPEVLRKSSRGQLTAKNRLMVSFCQLLSWLLTDFAILFSSFSTKTFRESTQLRGFLCALFLLMCPPSSSGPEVLRVSFWGQFDVKNRLPLSAFRLLSSLLT